MLRRSSVHVSSLTLRATDVLIVRPNGYLIGKSSIQITRRSRRQSIQSLRTPLSTRLSLFLPSQQLPMMTLSCLTDCPHSLFPSTQTDQTRSRSKSYSSFGVSCIIAVHTLTLSLPPSLHQRHTPWQTPTLPIFHITLQPSILFRLINMPHTHG